MKPSNDPRHAQPVFLTPVLCGRKNAFQPQFCSRHPDFCGVIPLEFGHASAAAANRNSLSCRGLHGVREVLL